MREQKRVLEAESPRSGACICCACHEGLVVYVITITGGHAEGPRGEAGGKGDPGSGLFFLWQFALVRTNQGPVRTTLMSPKDGARSDLIISHQTLCLKGFTFQLGSNRLGHESFR